MPGDDGVRFDSDQQNEFGPPVARQGGFDLVGFLVQTGMVQDRQMAQYVLIGIAALAFVAMFFVFWSGNKQTPPPPPPNMAVGQ
jgi:hypothetical protein